MAMTDQELGWLAGIVDGEGCIGMYTHKRKYMEATLVIGNTDPQVVVECHRLIREVAPSGRIRTIQPKGKRKQVFYEIRVSRRDDVRKILGFLLPCLRGAKRSQAELVLHGIEQRTQNGSWEHVESVHNRK